MGSRKSHRISKRHLADDFTWDSFPSLPVDPVRSPIDLSSQAAKSPDQAAGHSASKERKVDKSCLVRGNSMRSHAFS